MSRAQEQEAFWQIPFVPPIGFGGKGELADRLQSLADSAPAMMWMSDCSGACEYFNKSWLAFTGRTLQQELESGWKQSLHPDDRERVAVVYHEALERREPFEVEYRLRRHDGEYRWLLAAAAPRYDSETVFTGFVGSCLDITERKKTQIGLQELLVASDLAQTELAEQTLRLHRLADADPLTGVLNRRSFREQFDREWARVARQDRPLACIMVDIDFFKKVNDTHGHAAGDLILQHVAKQFVDLCRPTDRICRYGGEEFCILVPETHEQGAATLAERLRVAVADHQHDLGHKTIRATCSFGVACRRGTTDSVDELIARADRALSIAKLSGRNRVICLAAEDSQTDPANRGNAASLLNGRTADQLMSETPAIPDNANVAQAVAVLLRHQLNSAPVINESGRLVGMVLQSDLMMLNVSAGDWSRSVRDVMKSNVVSYEANVPAYQVFQFLHRSSISRVVILRAGKPIGTISPASFLNFFRSRIDVEFAGGSQSE